MAITPIIPRRRFEENDLPLLTRLRETMPNDTRIAFYRAHTLWAMHRFQEAYAAYDVRLHMPNVSRSNPVSQVRSSGRADTPLGPDSGGRLSRWAAAGRLSGGCHARCYTIYVAQLWLRCLRSRSCSRRA